MTANAGLAPETDPYDALPTLSVHIAELLAEVGRPRPASRAVCKAMTSHRGLFGFLKKVASHPVLGGGKRVSTAEQTLSALGARGVRDYAAIYASMRMSDRMSVGEFDRQAFWDRALVSASAARIVAQAVGFDGLDDAFAAAFLQDLGVIALAALHPEKSVSLQIIQLSPGETRVEQEIGLVHTDHVRVLDHLRLRWPFPEDLLGVAVHHHGANIEATGRRVRTLTAIAMVASHICDVFTTDGHPSTLIAAHDALARLDESVPSLPDLVSATNELAAELSPLFGCSAPRNHALAKQISPHKPKPQPTAEDYKREILQLRKERDELLRVVRRVTRELRAATQLDPLTATLDREHFVAQLKRTVAMARQLQQPVSVLIVDVDGLGGINDTYGDEAGNMVLKTVAARIHSVSRADDLVGRIDGGRFAIALPSAPADAAVVAARRIQGALNVAPVTTPAADEVTVSVSVGVGSVAAIVSRGAAEDLVREALTNLVRAKADSPSGLVWS